MGQDHKDGYRRALLEGHRIDPVHPWGKDYLTDADRAEVEIGLGLRAAPEPEPEPKPKPKAPAHKAAAKKAVPVKHSKTE